MQQTSKTFFILIQSTNPKQSFEFEVSKDLNETIETLQIFFNQYQVKSVTLLGVNGSQQKEQLWKTTANNLHPSVCKVILTSILKGVVVTDVVCVY